MMVTSEPSSDSASPCAVAGITLLKYWVSVSPEEQEKRFRESSQVLNGPDVSSSKLLRLVSALDLQAGGTTAALIPAEAAHLMDRDDPIHCTC